MSDDEEKVDGEINPDLLEAGLDDDAVIEEDVDLEDGDVPIHKLSEDEEEDGLIADSYDDDQDKW